MTINRAILLLDDGKLTDQERHQMGKLLRRLVMMIEGARRKKGKRYEDIGALAERLAGFIVEAASRGG